MKENNGHVVIAGGSGLIGSRLKQLLIQKDYRVSILTRDESLANQAGYIHWRPDQLSIEHRQLIGCDVLVNLAGAGVMSQAWTTDYKKLILQSRIDTYTCLQQALEKIQERPALISASAIGYYGFGVEDQVFEEDSLTAEGDYLKLVTQKWEEAANKAAAYCKRHVTFRIGIVLSKDGGALEEMQKGFKLGVGSFFAPGDQIYSWIHIDDLCGMLIKSITETDMSGTYNAVAPEPVSARDFAAALAESMYGSARLLPVPKFASKLALGERHTVLTKGAYVSSRKIERAGFQFQYPKIKLALNHLVLNQ